MENALDFLLDQAQEKEHNAVMALNKARSELENYHKQIEQIEQYRLDYCNQMVQRGMSGLTASQYGHLNRFLTQLDETLTKQRSAQSQFEQQVANCEKHWLEVRKQRRSYEWLLEKKRSEKQKAAERREQKELDEFTTLQFARRRESH
jgi:flagellar FliJ protein